MALLAGIRGHVQFVSCGNADGPQRRSRGGRAKGIPLHPGVPQLQASPEPRECLYLSVGPYEEW